MAMIYEAKGKAGEYSKYALNIYKNCTNGCLYCFSPLITHTSREEFYKNVSPRENIIKIIIKEAPQYSGKKVLMSFISDPYPKIEKELNITRQILQIFKDNKVIPVILTKNILALRDLDILKDAGGYFGTTLTILNCEKSLFWEPNASQPHERISLLQTAKKRGIKTWVSLEPVIEPEEALKIIDETHGFVDEYKVGKLNYMEEANKVDWKKFLQDVVEKLESYGCKYYIKESLRKYGGGKQ